MKITDVTLTILRTELGEGIIPTRGAVDELPQRVLVSVSTVEGIDGHYISYLIPSKAVQPAAEVAKTILVGRDTYGVAALSHEMTMNASIAESGSPISPASGAFSGVQSCCGAKPASWSGMRTPSTWPLSCSARHWSAMVLAGKWRSVQTPTHVSTRLNSSFCRPVVRLRRVRRTRRPQRRATARGRCSSGRHLARRWL
jgi:hypothetical protein